MYVDLSSYSHDSASDNGVFTKYNVGNDGFTKIFCACGRIVDIDTQTYRRRLSMHKDIECVTCRNSRIAAEIENLDEHYGVIEGEAVF